jgi:hypothetical protein
LSSLGHKVLQPTDQPAVQDVPTVIHGQLLLHTIFVPKPQLDISYHHKAVHAQLPAQQVPQHAQVLHQPQPAVLDII